MEEASQKELYVYVRACSVATWNQYVRMWDTFSSGLLRALAVWVCPCSQVEDVAWGLSHSLQLAVRAGQHSERRQNNELMCHII